MKSKYCDVIGLILFTACATPLYISQSHAQSAESTEIETRILGAMDRAMGARINTGESGKFHDHWKGAGRYHMHPEDLKFKQDIETRIAKTLEPLNNTEIAP